MRDRRRELLALHEGAHALALLKARAFPGLLEVVLDERGGRVYYGAAFGLNSDVAAKATVAGVVAEIVLGELDAVERAAALDVAGHDLDAALAAFKDKAHASACVVWATQWTRKHELEIQAIAQELQRKGRLSRAELLLICGLREADVRPRP